jgi:23S rRNA (uracil1939-C5)-methyltransferase
MGTVVTIRKIVHGGAGIAVSGGDTVFVDGVCEGEKAEIVEYGRRGGYPLARVERILEPSPHRRTPPCPLAGACGGCDWQHIDYRNQVELKKGIFAECMRRNGRIDLSEIEVFESPETGYRIRTQIKVDIKKKIAGFYRKMTNDVFPVGQCPVLNGPLNSLLGEIPSFLDTLPPDMREIKAISGDSGLVASSPALEGVSGEQVRITVGGKCFVVDGGGFFQANGFLLERMGIWAAGEAGGGLCVDAFGGAGFFSVLLCKAFNRGVLVETELPQVENARRNFAANGVGHFDAVHGAVEEFLRGAARTLPPVDCLIADPPRPGLTRSARESVRDLRPHYVLYFSCNPSTQARDCGFFVNRCGYRIMRAALFDLYPQTHHLETALLLQA